MGTGGEFIPQQGEYNGIALFRLRSMAAYKGAGENLARRSSIGRKLFERTGRSSYGTMLGPNGGLAAKRAEGLGFPLCFYTPGNDVDYGPGSEVIPAART